MLQTRKSNPSRPVRVLGYGPEGVGKSTLGAKSDRPVFVTPEGGVDQLTDAQGNPCEEIAGVDSWPKLVAAVRDLIEEQHEFKTLVLDSADWIEGLSHREIIGKSGKTITTVNGGYGAGYRQAQNMHQDLIVMLEELREKRGMNIVITAHAHVKPVKDPEMIEDYDSFEIKCHEMVSSIWREWVDALFFMRFRTFVKSDGETTRARALSDGTRVVYTVKQPSFQAKNRYGMPPELDYTLGFWGEFMKYARKEPQAENLKSVIIEIDELRALIQSDKTKDAVANAIINANGNVEKLTAIRARLREITAKGA